MTLAEGAQVFARLRPLFAAYAAQGVVLHDEAHRYYLGTHEVREKDEYRTWFGGVEIKKNYVSAHLIPVYVYPDLLERANGALRKRMQGKSCFNFPRLDEGLIGSFSALLDLCVERFVSDGRLLPALNR